MPAVQHSPFPGMDPYMERRWGDVHASLALEARTQLNRILPEDLYASSEEWIVLDAFERAAGRPDLFVVERPEPESESNGTATLVTAEPVRIRVLMDPLTQPFVEIRTADGDRLVTSLEWVSPTNKNDRRAREQFREKHDKVLNAGANSVEIDLTRGGDRERLVDPAVLPQNLRSDYLAVVFRAEQLLEAEAYPMPLRQRLPIIAIPLRPEDDDVPLDLQALVDITWRDGRYWKTDYSRPLDPPFPKTDAAWVEGRLRAWPAERTD